MSLEYKYPIYGYHEHKQAFLRIELYEPKHIKKCAQILGEGVVFGVEM